VPWPLAARRFRCHDRLNRRRFSIYARAPSARSDKAKEHRVPGRLSMILPATTPTSSHSLGDWFIPVQYFRKQFAVAVSRKVDPLFQIVFGEIGRHVYFRE